MERLRRKRQARLIITLLTFVAFAVLVYAIRHQIIDTLRNLDKVNPWALLLMIPLQFLNYHAYTRMYQAFFAFLNHPIDYKPMFRTNVELNFVNNVFPSGGVSGISYFSLRMREFGVSPGKATLVQIMKFALLFASFQIMLFFGLFFLALDGQANGITILISGSIATLLFVLTVVLGFVVGSKQRINAFFTALARWLNRLIQVFRRKNPETINLSKVQEVFEDLHASYVLVRGNSALLKRVFFCAMVANITEVLTIYVVYIAFDQWINPGAVILAYAIANFAGLISVLPGGVGIYEALMTAVLATAGVPPKLSIPVTVMYRVLSMALHLIPGAYYYHKSLHERVE